VKVITEVGRLRWLEHLFRVQEQNRCRKLTLHKPEGTRQVGRPAIELLDSVEDDLKTNWRQTSQDRDQWEAVVKEPEVHYGLQRRQKKNNMNY
jgi:hypothetical protein